MSEVQMPDEMIPEWVSRYDAFYDEIIDYATKAQGCLNSLKASSKGYCPANDIFSESIHQKMHHDIVFGFYHSFVEECKRGNYSITLDTEKEATQHDLVFKNGKLIKIRPDFHGIYRGLMNKYAGRIETEVNKNIAKRFVEYFGHGNWQYVGERLDPRFDNWIVDSVDTKKGKTTLYHSTGEGMGFRVPPQTIDWGFSSIGNAEESVDLIHQIVIQSLPQENRIAFTNFINTLKNTIEQCSKNTVLYGQKVSCTLGSFEMTARFQKTKFLVTFDDRTTKTIFDFIKTYYFNQEK